MENIRVNILKKLMVIVMSLVMISTAFCVYSTDESYGATSSLSKQRITGVKLSQPISCEKIKVSWNKKRNLTGYEIYRATAKNGKYYLKKRVTRTAWTNTGLRLGKTYYYKVRGYKKINGKRIYTKFSSVRGMKTAYIKPIFTIKTEGKDGKFNVTIKNSMYSKNLRVYLDVACFAADMEKKKLYPLTNIKKYVPSAKKYVKADAYIVIAPGRTAKLIGNVVVGGANYDFKNSVEEGFFTGLFYRNNVYVVSGNSSIKRVEKFK